MVVEVMGRNAGWIALASGLAGNASIILLPEVDWRWYPIVHKLKQRSCDRQRYSLIVAAEGARIPGEGQMGTEKEDKKAHDRIKLGGIGKFIADEITKRTGLETRSSVLGHLQRGGSPTSYDRILASKFGVFAAELALNGEYGFMASLSGTQIVKVPITGEMKQQRLVDVETDQMVHAARMVGTIFGDETDEQLGQIVCDGD